MAYNGGYSVAPYQTPTYGGFNQPFNGYGSDYANQVMQNAQQKINGYQQQLPQFQQQAPPQPQQSPVQPAAMAVIPVTTIDEVKAYIVPLDGSKQLFYNANEDTYYTKQIDLTTGNAPVGVYKREQPAPEAEPVEAPEESGYERLERDLANCRNQCESLRAEITLLRSDLENVQSTRYPEFAGGPESPGPATDGAGQDAPGTGVKPPRNTGKSDTAKPAKPGAAKSEGKE